MAVGGAYCCGCGFDGYVVGYVDLEGGDGAFDTRECFQNGGGG